jgi:hypothetical protein
VSTELISALTSQLGITSKQASGGAGLLMKLARERLSPGEFQQVAAAVPGLDGLLKAAPAAGGGGVMGMFGKAVGGNAGELAQMAGGFSKLGLNASMIQKFIPVIMGYVQQQGGASVAGILQKAMKK